MTILVLGDSFTFGAELPDLPSEFFSFQGNSYWDEESMSLVGVSPSQLAWPTLLGQKLNQDVVNLSLVGGSNSRIFRKAINETSINNYDLVICAWTALGRFDLSFEGQDYCLSLGSTLGGNNSSSAKYKWFKDFVVNHYDTKHDIERTLAEILALQSYFKQKNQKYLFVNAMVTTTDPNYRYLIDQLDHNYFIEYSSSFCIWCRDLPRGPGGHFLEQGHELVAQRMFDYIKKLNLL